MGSLERIKLTVSAVVKQDSDSAHQAVTSESATAWSGVVIFSLVAALLVVYANTIHNPFVFDDIPELLQNLDTQNLAACRNTIGGSQNTGLSGRPFACLTFAANMVTHGPDVRGFHVVNILILMLSSIVLYLVLQRTIENSPSWQSNRRASWIAGIIALLWAVHPLQTESVTYIIQRIESLAGLLFLLTLYCSIHVMKKPVNWPWGILAVLCCALGMLTKEIVAVAPLVVFLYDVVFVSRSWTRPFKYRPFFYLTLFGTWMIPILLITQSPRSGTVGFGLGVSALDYLRTQSNVLLHCVRLTFYPYPQSISYSDWPIARDWRPALVPGFVVLLLLSASIVGTMKKRWWGFCGMWFFLILAPSSSFVPIVTEPAAERRMYLPLAGILTILVFLLYRLAESAISSERRRSVILAIVFGSAVFALSARTMARNRLYRDPIDILSNDLNVRPGDELLRGALVDELVRAGRLRDAQSVHQEGITRNPDSFILYDNWARAMSSAGNPSEAVTSFAKALQLRPDHPPSLTGLGVAYIQLGRYTEAVSALERALQLAPNSHSIHANLGIALASLGRTDEAIEVLRKSVELKSNFADGHYNLGRLLAAKGDLHTAIEHLRIAVALKPDDSESQRLLDELLHQQPIPTPAHAP